MTVERPFSAYLKRGGHTVPSAWVSTAPLSCMGQGSAGQMGSGRAGQDRCLAHRMRVRSRRGASSRQRQPSEPAQERLEESP